ncbi:uncharacterized protein LOC121803041 isoform X1 [Salvia splendens]|uniref:uncharacterized protein LOC121803041 isoform X1 n=1 Tax=Salvia splendens TaxID=180675 RepID=UPI001C278BB1|nr:uncharacterized protein LOC121803041 isoform X1 [Salvia splendens]
MKKMQKKEPDKCSCAQKFHLLARNQAFGETASNIYNTKSSIMKKSKLEFINSREVKNLAAMKNKVVHKNHRYLPLFKSTKTSNLSIILKKRDIFSILSIAISKGVAYIYLN